MQHELGFKQGETIYCLNVNNGYIMQGIIIGHHPEWDNDWNVEGYTIYPYTEHKNNRKETYSDFWIFYDLKDALTIFQESKHLNDYQMIMLAFQSSVRGIIW
jgi:hypothetical protein